MRTNLRAHESEEETVMKDYDIKQAHKVEALKKCLAEIAERENDAVLLGASEADMWAYQEIRSLIKKRIAEVKS